MKTYKYILLSFLTLNLSFFNSNYIFGQKNTFYKPLENLGIIEIKMADWLNDKKSCVSFTFDDSDSTHVKIASILDSYNFHGSFYINCNSKDWSRIESKYFNLINNGHEIGNHTYNHADLLKITLDSINIEIANNKNYIIDKFHLYPTSFVHPRNKISEPIDSIVFLHHLFSRRVSLYNGKRIIYPMDETVMDRKIISLNRKSNIQETFFEIRNSMKFSKWVVFAGHGINDSRYEPISEDFLIQLCEFIKLNINYIWVGTFSEIALYENLKNEITLDIQLSNNIVDISINNIDKKYLIMKSIPITLKIKTENKKIIIANEKNYFMEFNEFENYYLITFNLKEIQYLSFDVE